MEPEYSKNFLEPDRPHRSIETSRSSGARSPRLLPPITLDGDANPKDKRPASKLSRSCERLWSRYHIGCIPKSTFFTDWRDKPQKKKNNCGKTRKNDTQSSSNSNLKDDEVIDFLNHNKDILEAYILENVSLDDIRGWLSKKLANNFGNESPNRSRQRNKEQSSKKEKFLALISRLQDDPSEHSIILELANCISKTVDVDAYRVFKIFPDLPSFVQFFDVDDDLQQTNTLVRADSNMVELILEVARRGRTWRLSRDEEPRKFPVTPFRLFKNIDEGNPKEANHILYQPFLTATGKTSYVIEMWRVKDKFKDIDEDISSNFLVWGSLSLHYCSMYLDKMRERNMSDFLLDVVKAIFEEMVSLDQLIKRILEFAQRLVNADRASLFLVDYRNFELVSTVFDLKYEPGQNRDVEKKEIRMPISRGIAGHVALSGETMNIPDAYSDYRFNREVDEATGYKTVSILCMPVKVQGKVIGVVQMVNKRNDDNFDHEDEVAFEIFSTFFGLALHHARLYDRIMRKEQKYKVAMEVLSYHNTCRENEVRAILNDKDQSREDLNDFYIDPYKFNEFEKCKAVITMFSDLFDLSNFDIITLTRFILTVKKNYRTVPYHNFDHGWSVAQAMYVIMKNDIRKRFDYKTRLALFIACLCHDLDHRGYTNKYMSETASPLAAMYTTSTLEHHHFNITVTILQQDGHNIFSHMSSSDYKDILGLIRHCILATDLAAFFPNLEKMKELYRDSSQKFSWSSSQHRELAMAMSMTASDLSASAKPWEVQLRTVKVIFEEFYDQGDKEREAGRIPIPMMDRNKLDEQPASQIGFLSQICIPCYLMLYRILPTTKPMYVMALKNLSNWKYRADKVLRKIEDDTELPDEIEISVEEVSEESDIEVAIEELEGAIGEIDVVGMEEVANEESVVWQGIKRTSLSWEDDEGGNSEEKVSTGIWKKIDGEWIDEEGVVVKQKRRVIKSARKS